jgi:hypothetical protein
MAVLERTIRAEIERQKTYDRRRPLSFDSLGIRLASVMVAQEALVEREIGAEWALRQALVDLSSAAETLAESLS